MTKLQEYKQQYYQKYKERLSILTKEWKQKNIQKVNQYHNEYQKTRCKTDINYRLAKNLRTRLNSALKRNTKSGSAVKDLDCTIDEFKIYLQSKFQEGMTWDNYGEWEIDHIIPISKFNLSDREQLLKACHYTNQQPLWAIDNQRKNNRKIDTSG